VVLQRVSRAAVEIDGDVVGAIDRGLLLLAAFRQGDTDDDLRWMARKCVDLRIFSDDAGKMNRSLLDVGGSALVVSQFTLYGDSRKGRRPSFVESAPPEVAEALYERFAREVAALGVEVATGRFGAMMQVSLVNDGPVTLILDRGERSREVS
jgi:D-tyrosyl-tRNA(Tyr) deacylase